MPALVAFGRPWQIGSDDFVFPGILALIVRIPWLSSVSVVYWWHQELLDSVEEGCQLARIYLVGAIATGSVAVTSIALLTTHSMRGSVLDTDARRLVPKLLYFRIFAIFPEMTWHCIGAAWLFSGAMQCVQDAWFEPFVAAIIAINLLLSVLVILELAVTYDPCRNVFRRSPDAAADCESVPDFFDENRSRSWLCRLRFCCGGCVSSGEDGRDDAFRQIGGVLATLSYGVDVVPSDIIAGIILLGFRTKKLGRPTYDPSATDTSDVPDWMTVDKADHYFRFAFGCYSWGWYVVSNPKCGLCRLVCTCFRCACVKRRPNYVDGDNCCMCHTNALQRLTHLGKEDLLFVSFKNHVCEMPFYVAVDHETSSIVVAIRGTWSLRDAITDGLLDSEPLDIDGLPKTFQAHKGFVKAARCIKSKLDEHQVIEEALTTYAGYGLVFLGHSSGAATACILSMYYRQRFPFVRCIAFSPPSASFNREAAEHTRNYTFTVLLGDDYAVRVHMEAIERLKRSILEQLAQATLPKYKILARGIWSCFFGSSQKMIEKMVPLSGEEQMRKYESLGDVRKDNTVFEKLGGFPKFLPGKILHITRPKEVVPKKDEFELRWAKQEDFRDFVISPHTLTDHFLDIIQVTLATVTEQMKGVTVQK